MKNISLIKKIMMHLLFGVMVFILSGLSATVKAEPMSEKKLYGIASISKIITAAAVMKLSEMELVDLDTAVVEYLPEFTMQDERYREITVKMLLNHSSGLGGMTSNNMDLLGDNNTYAHDHFLRNLSQQQLKHKPGERSIYSNDSFALAELVIERVSGMSFSAFIETYFCKPLGISNILTPQSDFDREQLVPNYFGSLQVKPESLNSIASGGMYATAEDLCQLTQIFMDDNDILSKESKEAMAQYENMGAFSEKSADSIFGYGLGFDSVNMYPFGNYGIQALAKGGNTQFYNSYTTILPEENISAVVLTSGRDSFENIIVQEMILDVLSEEGLLEKEEIQLPEVKKQGQPIDDKWYAYEGLYGGMEMMEVKFSGEEMQITTLVRENSRTFHFLHIGAGEFVSQNGDYIDMSGALVSAENGIRGVTTFKFVENEAKERYLYASTYVEAGGLGNTAASIPFAMQVDENKVRAEKWQAREENNYLLVNEISSSVHYLCAPVLRLSEEMGYLQNDVYEGAGFPIQPVKIADENTAVPFQAVPVMPGRDANYVSALQQEGREYLMVNEYRFISETEIAATADISSQVTISKSGETVWFRSKPDGEEQWQLEMPEKTAYFVYDEDFECVASSLEKDPSFTISIPENGYIAFAGEPGITIGITK